MVYTPGLLVGQLSGKAGSTLAGSSRSAFTIGVNKAPRRSSTPAQLQQRLKLGSRGALWSTLDEGQITGWIALGAAMKTRSRSGVQIIRTGYGAFQLINGHLDSALFDRLLIAPAQVIPPGYPIFAVTAVAEPTNPFSLTATYDVSPQPAGLALVVEAWPPMASSIRSIPRKGSSIIQVVSPGDTSPVDLTDSYLAKFGPWHPGDQLLIAFRQINDSGFALQRFDTSTIST